MRRDIRDSDAFRKAESFLVDAYAIGSAKPYDLLDLAVSPDGRTVAATGVILDQLAGLPEQRIVLVDLETGAVRRVTDGPNRDRLPRWDPAGERIAYLSDAATPYDFQLSILTLATGHVARFPLEERWVEFLQWSSDGRGILLLAAGRGADLAGAQGAISAPTWGGDAPAWAPYIDSGTAASHWRTLWILDPVTGSCRQVSPPDLNIWEACWCGTRQIACIASNDPSEEAWYSADVRLLDVADGGVSTLYVPTDQLGWISASPSGAGIAFVEAVCSDRMLVAGTLMLGHRGDFVPVNTMSTDVTFTAWQHDDTLLLAGLRGFETVLGVHHLKTSVTEEIWCSPCRTIGGPLYPDAAPAPVVGTAVFMSEGHLSPPALVVAARGKAARTLSVLDPVPAERAHPGAVLDRIEWAAPDGLGIQGWLIRPPGNGPHPLVMDVHGGPVWRSRPRYVGRGGYAGMLLRAGYAIFQPNPRGSSGQGQAFARHVFGDAGGADAGDLLSGLDYLTERGLARADRIGIIGGSYGGFMTAWLITQDQRFAAAVAIAPVSDWTSLHLTSHVPSSIEMMLGGEPHESDGRYSARSPIAHASKARTPTLIIAGELDRSTPPGQGVELHHALQRGGGNSVLLTYPGEGHGVRQFPAVIDFVARITDWFAQNMPRD